MCVCRHKGVLTASTQPRRTYQLGTSYKASKEQLTAPAPLPRRAAARTDPSESQARHTLGAPARKLTVASPVSCEFAHEFDSIKAAKECALKQSKKHLTSEGKIFLLTSSLTKGINWGNWKKKKLAEKKMFFEKLFVYELRQ
jgi:hypothetical protein